MPSFAPLPPSIPIPASPSVNEEKCGRDGVTDTGIQQSENLMSAAKIAAAATNAFTALDMANLQKDLANSYASLAKRARDYYTNSYKPLERAIIAEAASLKKYARDHDSLTIGQMIVGFKASTAGALEDKLKCTSRYCTGQRQAIIREGAISEASAQSSIAGLGHRYEEEREAALNDIRWERRSNTMKLGRDLQVEAISYSEFAAGIFGNIGEQAAKAATGSVRSYFYDRSAIDPVYPDRRGELVIPGRRSGSSGYSPPVAQPRTMAPATRKTVTKILG